MSVVRQIVWNKEVAGSLLAHRIRVIRALPKQFPTIASLAGRVCRLSRHSISSLREPVPRPFSLFLSSAFRLSLSLSLRGAGRDLRHVKSLAPAPFLPFASGHLFVTKVVIPCRTFLRRLYDVLKSQQSRHHIIGTIRQDLM